ncbi:cold-shock protein [Myroides indicus]|uniref:Cold shock CspA family protein n=1 Tax=Myroides indicus TaxID=1323422 RepID=A0A4R7F225_9FLAO|nr:cold shock domain-containing protein [Myroides indicus]TDS62122.1 cold shock CspA family protein [Myroides indicus]
MADSFGKKENSKKKAKKQQEKAARREDRKTNNNKGKDFDDMIVYVDVNGNFTSIPPHLQNREEDLAKAKRPDSNTEDTPENAFTGTVTYFSEKGYGFITEDRTGENVFFHHGQLNQTVNKNDRVGYKKEGTPKGYKAIDIKVIIN